MFENVINYKYNNASTTTNDIDCEALRPPFGFVLIEIIKKTFKVTTQYACTLTLYNDMRKHCKSTLMLRKERSLLQRILFIQTMQQ
jgi:hypothetical protein